ncbi:MAG TPA: hypothetical protein VFG83_14670, partial [Kofleriaceae bacterium]|nr:hypothetical protein [Kofleriaceae bacterium]
AKSSAIEAHVAAAKPAPPPPVAAAEAAPPPPVAAAEAAPPPPVAPAEAAPPSLTLGNAVPAAGADAAPAKEATVGGDTAAATPRDPGLARVSQINVAQVRDARRAAGFVIAPAPTPSREPGASSGYSAPVGADDSGDDDPIYTKWWFWGIAAVGAFIVYKFATADNDRGDAIAGPPPPASIRQPVLFRF